MPDALQAPRIPPVAPADQDQDIRDFLSGLRLRELSAFNVFATVARHPGLFRKWSPFCGKLLAGKLSIRDRELLILRTGWLCGSGYEWGHHALIARANGFTNDDLARIRVGSGAEDWSEVDSALLAAAEELHHRACISDGTWKVLSDTYDERQLIELIMLVGHYHMVSFVLNSLRVQREPGVPSLEE
jgi:4-carboxymuconolactone decarboxylase